MRGVRLLSRCRTDIFDDCAVPRLFVDIVKLPLKPPPLCVKQNMVTNKNMVVAYRHCVIRCDGIIVFL